MDDFESTFGDDSNDFYANKDFNSYFGDDSDDFYAVQNSFEREFGNDSNDAYANEFLPNNYDPLDRVDVQI